MFKLHLVQNQTIACHLLHNEIQVTWKDEDNLIVYLQTFKDSEIIDALQCFENLILAVRIELTLKRKKVK